MENRTKIWTDVDYEAEGKQIGWLSLHHSVTRSAYGNIMIPIAVIKRGKGPTVLLMAGNHGDEYEGQIVLNKLIRRIRPEDVTGRLIVLPAANLPAALAGARVSPIDQGNLNRAFPGDPDGGITAQIAHYIDSVLYPMCDAVQDLHAGGSSLEYLPFASMRLSGKPDLDARSMAALKAFGPPIGLVWAHSLDRTLSASAANMRGVVNLGGEFGGAGMVSRSGVAIIEEGLPRFLAHLGLMPLPPGHPAPKAPPRLMEVKDKSYFCYAPEAGLFEPAVNLGDTVEKGQLAGHVLFVDNPAREPVPAYFSASALVICRRAFGRCERGDCLFHLASDWVG